MTPTKIAIIDDSTPVRKLGERLLTKEGYEVVTAVNGIEGVSLIVKEKPDFVLMDVEMPEMDGLTATLLITSAEKTKHIPVILLTSKSSPFDKARGEMAGARGHITKPFSKTVLINTMETVAKELSP